MPVGLRAALPIVVAMTLFALAASSPPEVPSPEVSLSTHEERSIEGFRVLVEKSLIARDAELTENALRELENQLYRVARAVPSPALAKLRQVPIWLSDKSKTICAAYHPSREFLATHDGYDVRMAKAVELGSASNFIAWTHVQPWMVLHELAHAYHDQVLGFDHDGIKAAFARATAEPRWSEVLYGNGGRKRHYALTDEKEWFAEASEAFFGTNDFFPFVRSELRELDAAADDLCAELWGAPRR